MIAKPDEYRLSTGTVLAERRFVSIMLRMLSNDSWPLRQT